MRKKIIKKRPIRKIIREVNLEPIDVIEVKNVYKVSLSLINGDHLSEGDIIKHIKVLKVLTVTKKENHSADVGCEVIRRRWEETKI